MDNFDILKLKQSYIAFDFFDTVVHRDCHPEVVLFEWSKHMSAFLNFVISPSELYNLRKKCEREQKKKMVVEELKYTSLLTAVYTELEKSIFGGKYISKESFLEKAKVVEENIEFCHLSVDEQTLNWLRDLKSSDKRVVLISDFYADEKLISNLLNRLNIKEYFNYIFVSSDYGKRKSTGTLYELVLNKLNTTSNEIFMIGDNEISDVLNPQKIGLEAYHKKYTESFRTISKRDIQRKFMNDLREVGSDNLFDLYLPEVVYFISKLHKKLVQSNTKHILFCSREGQFLKKLFDLYQTNYNFLPYISSDYFYVSRKSTLYPSFKPLMDENFDILFRQYKELSLENFLLTLGFSDNEIIEIAEQLNVESSDFITASSQILFDLKRNHYFTEKFEVRRIAESTLFLQYVESLNLDLKNKSMAICDIGWKGTIQDNIQSALGKEIDVEGFYLGLDFSYYSSTKFDRKEGILFTDFPRQSRFYKLFNYKSLFYERIFVADHGPVIGYLESTSTSKPKLDTNPEHIKLFLIAKKLQAELLEAFNSILKFYEDSPFLPFENIDEVAIASLRKHCHYMPKLWKDIKKLDLAAEENFGQIRTAKKASKLKRIKNIWSNRNYFFVDYLYRFSAKSYLLIKIVDVYATLLFYFKYLGRNRT